MSQNVDTKLLSRFITVYGDPKTDSIEAFFREYRKALGGFSDSVLELAGDRILANHTYPTWPTVGECVKLCREAALILYPRTAPEHAKLDPEPEKKYVDPERVNDLLSSFAASFGGNNDFTAIKERCPIGGTIDVSAPWGQEVTDRNGNVVPIRKKNRSAA